MLLKEQHLLMRFWLVVAVAVVATAVPVEVVVP
jgi:hypothetical protein